MSKDTRDRRRENCDFYPACYVAGDCPLNGWQTGKCGLSDDDKAVERKAFKDSLERNSMRLRLIERARRGEFDHLDVRP